MARHDLPQSYTAAERLLGRRDTRLVANNTRVIRRHSTLIAVQFHRTDVVSFWEDGTVTLNTGGWTTVTTKDRINRCLFFFRLYSERGTWVLHRDDGVAFLYQDGVRLRGATTNAELYVRRRGRRPGVNHEMVLPSAVPWLERHGYHRIPRPEIVVPEPVQASTGWEEEKTVTPEDIVAMGDIEDERWAEYNRKFNALIGGAR